MNETNERRLSPMGLCNCLQKTLSQLSFFHSHNSTLDFFNFIIQFYYCKVLIYLRLETQVKKFATIDVLRSLPYHLKVSGA